MTADQNESTAVAEPLAQARRPLLNPSKVIRVLARQARLTVQFAQRQAQVQQLSEQILQIHRIGIEEVSAEEDEIAQLGQFLALATDAFDALTAAREAEGSSRLTEQQLTEQELTEQLDEIEHLLNAPEWELAEFYAEELTRKHQRQVQQVKSANAELERLQKSVEEMRNELVLADRLKAPVRAWRVELGTWEAILAQALRAQRDEEYGGLLDAVARLGELPTALEDMRKKLTPDIRQASKFLNHADLLLMQLPLDEQKRRYQYDALLRTPSMPGTPGIFVQDTSTLVQEDRAQLDSVLGRIAQAVDEALARGDGFATRGEPRPPSPRLRRPTRSWLYSAPGAGAPTSELPPVDLNFLVREMGNLMYRLFIPEQMQQYLRDIDCSITLTTNDLELPWEFMYCEHYYREEEAADIGDAERSPGEQELDAELDADDARYLCLCRPVARMPMGQAFPMISSVQARRRDQVRFLLIGDPTGDLPQARREIELLHRELDALNNGLPVGETDPAAGEEPEPERPAGGAPPADRDYWQRSIQVTTLIGKDATGRRLNELLSSGEFDVIHYSGHAAFDKDRADLSGLRLAGDEPFYAQKIRRLLQGQPLVFLNACESGLAENTAQLREEGASAEEWKRNLFNLKRPAEGLASAFIYAGAKGCIGSLWPIYDEPAARFAIQFYRYVLDEYMIGEAMRLTRRAIKRNPEYGITWAAYVLYGDPTYRLGE